MRAAPLAPLALLIAAPLICAPALAQPPASELAQEAGAPGLNAPAFDPNFDAAAAFENLVLRDPDSAWTVYSLQRNPDRALASANAPGVAYLALEDRLALENRLASLNARDRAAVELLAARDFENGLDPATQSRLLEEARGYYAALPADERAAMAAERRELFRSMTATELARWRYQGGAAFISLIEPQKDIFRARALETFAVMTDDQRRSLYAEARALEDARMEARLAAERNEFAPVAASPDELNTFTSEEQIYRFNQMSPEEQREYLDRLRARQRPEN